MLLRRLPKWIAPLPLALTLMGCSGDAEDEPVPQAEAETTGDLETLQASGALATDVVLVHGAWADGSSWANVTAALQQRGYTVRAVQLGDHSVTDDAAVVRHTIETIGRPVVVAGHSYGGFVISEATTGLTSVVSLVYVAAFAPDEGESIGQVASDYPPAPAVANLVVDDLGDSVIEPEAFVKYFAPDIPKKDAQVLAATQHPTSVTILSSPASEPGWRTIPSYYQVSLDDQVIDPGLQQHFAERMGAQTIELHASHVSLISHVPEVSQLIDSAAHGSAP